MFTIFPRTCWPFLLPWASLPRGAGHSVLALVTEVLLAILEVRPQSAMGNWWFSSVQSLSRVRLLATPWITALQASLSLTSLVAQRLKRLPSVRDTWVQSLGQEEPLEKEMATHSSILAWRIQWTEEPGRLQSRGLQRAGHDWATSLSGLPVHHHLPELTQTHVHRVSDAIQPSHPLSSPSPPAPNPSQHQSLFQWINSSHEAAKVLEFQL